MLKKIAVVTIELSLCQGCSFGRNYLPAPKCGADTYSKEEQCGSGWICNSSLWIVGHLATNNKNVLYDAS